MIVIKSGEWIPQGVFQVEISHDYVRCRGVIPGDGIDGFNHLLYVMSACMELGRQIYYSQDEGGSVRESDAIPEHGCCVPVAGIIIVICL